MKKLRLPKIKTWHVIIIVVFALFILAKAPDILGRQASIYGCDISCADQLSEITVNNERIWCIQESPVICTMTQCTGTNYWSLSCVDDEPAGDTCGTRYEGEICSSIDKCMCGLTCSADPAGGSNICIPSTCGDIDNGQYIYEPSYVLYNSVKYPDACVDSNTVRETYCDTSNVKKTIDKDCASGYTCTGSTISAPSVTSPGYCKASVVVCDNDGKCEAGETESNCPNDCKVDTFCKTDCGFCTTSNALCGGTRSKDGVPLEENGIYTCVNFKLTWSQSCTKCVDPIAAGATCDETISCSGIWCEGVCMTGVTKCPEPPADCKDLGEECTPAPNNCCEGYCEQYIKSDLTNGYKCVAAPDPDPTCQDGEGLCNDGTCSPACQSECPVRPPTDESGYWSTYFTSLVGDVIDECAPEGCYYYNGKAIASEERKIVPCCEGLKEVSEGTKDLKIAICPWGSFACPAKITVDKITYGTCQEKGALDKLMDTIIDWLVGAGMSKSVAKIAAIPVLLFGGMFAMMLIMQLFNMMMGMMGNTGGGGRY